MDLGSWPHRRRDALARAACLPVPLANEVPVVHSDSGGEALHGDDGPRVPTRSPLRDLAEWNQQDACGALVERQIDHGFVKCELEALVLLLDGFDPAVKMGDHESS